MAQRDLSARRIIGFACNQAFAFFLLFMGASASPYAQDELSCHIGLVLSLCFMVAGFVVTRALPKELRDKALSRPLLYVYAIAMGAGALLSQFAMPSIPATAALALYGLLAGLPCAFLLTAWGRSFGDVPSASSVPEVFLGSLVAAFFCLAFALVGNESPGYLVLCILPLGSVVNIEIPNADNPHKTVDGPEQDESRSLSSKVLTGTLFLGLAAGLACAVDIQTASAPSTEFLIGMVLFGAFLLGALSLLLSDGFGRGAALNKSYRLAIFVMMAGVLLVPWPESVASALPGESLVLAGYLGLEAVLVSLFLELAKLTGEDAALSFSSGFAALFAGEAIGVVVRGAMLPVAPFAVVSLAGLVALISYLFLFTERDFDELSRIVTKTDDFEATCARITEEFGLSKRESEILVFALRGRTSERIASELVISKSTVDTHLRRIYAKCGVHSRQELIDLAGL